MSEMKKPKLSSKDRAGIRKAAEQAALEIIKYLDDGAEVPGVLCEACRIKTAKKAYTRLVYETPGADKQTQKYFCGPECLEDHILRDDLLYFTCDKCDRMIRSQNPWNPGEPYHREYEGETLCLECYETLPKN